MSDGRPTLHGNRVVLRAPRPDDVADRIAAGYDPEFRRMVGAPPRAPGPITLAEAERWYEAIDRDPFAWIVDHDARCIGVARLHGVDHTARHASLAIGLFAPQHRGRGLGTESVRLLVRHAFDALALSVVRLRVLAFNSQAIACYRRCGFREVGRTPVSLDGGPAVDIRMEVTPVEFRAAFSRSTQPLP